MASTGRGSYPFFSVWIGNGSAVLWNRQTEAADGPDQLIWSDWFFAAAAGGGPVSVTPATATLTLVTFAPTVLTPVLVTPTTATLTVSTFAPTILTPVLVTPSIATLTLSLFAPTVSVGINVVPTTATLTTALFAPTVTATNHQLVTLTTASLTISTFAPTILTPQLVTPGIGALSLSTFAPIVSASAHQVVTPATATVTISLFAPIVAAGTFPVQFIGVRIAGYDLSLVAVADAPSGMGGVMKLSKNGTNFALYLVETTDPNASAVRLKTTTGTKAIRVKT